MTRGTIVLITIMVGMTPGITVLTTTMAGMADGMTLGTTTPGTMIPGTTADGMADGMVGTAGTHGITMVLPMDMVPTGISVAATGPTGPGSPRPAQRPGTESDPLPGPPESGALP